MRSLVLTIHLTCAAAATICFWIAGLASKGGSLHRAAGRWFTRLVFLTAWSGGAMAVARLLVPGLIQVSADSPIAAAQAVSFERQTMWLVLYVLLIIVAPAQHGAAVVAAGATPSRVRSRTHATLTLGAMLGSLALIPAALLWERWLFLIIAPIGLIVGFRQLKYATQQTATPGDWEREHLTSMITAGITLHTALLVFGATRTLSLTLHGLPSLLPWSLPAIVGLPVIIWLRRTWRRHADGTPGRAPEVSGRRMLR